MSRRGCCSRFWKKRTCSSRLAASAATALRATDVADERIGRAEVAELQQRRRRPRERWESYRLACAMASRGVASAAAVASSAAAAAAALAAALAALAAAGDRRISLSTSLSASSSPLQQRQPRRAFTPSKVDDGGAEGEGEEALARSAPHTRLSPPRS